MIDKIKWPWIFVVLFKPSACGFGTWLTNKNSWSLDFLNHGQLPSLDSYKHAKSNFALFQCKFSYLSTFPIILPINTASVFDFVYHAQLHSLDSYKHAKSNFALFQCKFSCLSTFPIILPINTALVFVQFQPRWFPKFIQVLKSTFNRDNIF